MEQKILADILDKTIEIDIKPAAKNLVLNFTFNKVTEVMIFTKDLGDIYQEKLKEYYIECASIRYSNCINRKKILNYKLNKFLSYYKIPQCALIEEYPEIMFGKYKLQKFIIDFYYVDRDHFTINFATPEIFMATVDNTNYYILAEGTQLNKYLHEKGV